MCREAERSDAERRVGLAVGALEARLEGSWGARGRVVGGVGESRAVLGGAWRGHRGERRVAERAGRALGCGVDQWRQRGRIATAGRSIG